ncbi:hypothetical protein [Kocuria oceani]|uniref:Uncharacterized protein n=1 Tax=Kocuria oceani TaxID=988827 RepID=A0ABV9TJK5_9MICC|nr:hypothetical protein [Kocuria oceani]
MNAETIDGQLDLLELLASAEESPAFGAQEIRGPGALVVFHVRVGGVREDGTRYLATAGRCGLCGRRVATDDPAAGGLGTRDDATGDRWAFEYCGRCRRSYSFSPLLRYAIDDGTFHLQIHDDPGDCDHCDRIASGSWISCQHGRGPLYDQHVCAVCGRTFKGSRDPAGLHGYGPVSAAHCSEACSRPAYEMVQARYAALTNTPQED